MSANSRGSKRIASRRSASGVRRPARRASRTTQLSGCDCDRRDRAARDTESRDAEPARGSACRTTESARRRRRTSSAPVSSCHRRREMPRRAATSARWRWIRQREFRRSCEPGRVPRRGRRCRRGSHHQKRDRARRNAAAAMIAIAMACQSSCCARSTLPLPNDRAMALVTAPPIAPPDNICININPGRHERDRRQRNGPELTDVPGLHHADTRADDESRRIRSGHLEQRRENGSFEHHLGARRHPVFRRWARRPDGSSSIASDTSTPRLRRAAASMQDGGTLRRGKVEAAADRVVRRRARREMRRRKLERLARRAVDDDRIGDAAGCGIDDADADTVVGEVFVAPREQREQHRPEVEPFARQYVFIARRAFASTRVVRISRRRPARRAAA